MKRRIKKQYIIIILLIIFVLIFLPRNLKNNDSVNYVINGFNVSENINNNKTNIAITNNEIKYYYILDKKDKKVVSNIELYKDDNYNCLYLTFNDRTNINDLVCIKDNINYYYSTGVIKNEKIDNYYNELISQKKINRLYNDKATYQKKDLYTFYTNNILDEYILFISTYKGLYKIDKDIEEINLFDKDVYDQRIKAFIKNKYVIANYNQQYDFDSFYVVDLKSEKISTIKSKYNISFNSSINYDENYIYLHDLDNDKYYELDIDNKSIRLINKITNNLKYLNNYEILKKIDNTYYIKKNNILYKSNYENLVDLTHLFDISDKYNLQIGKNYICFNEDLELICYYNNSYQTIVSNNEFKFNKTINYYFYKK